mgnify:CR=1 FL=1
MLPPDRQPVIIAARRTPVCRTNGVLQSLRAHELLAPVLRELLAETGAEPGRVTDVVIGNAVGGGGPGGEQRQHGLGAALPYPRLLVGPLAVVGLAADDDALGALDDRALPTLGRLHAYLG